MCFGVYYSTEELLQLKYELNKYVEVDNIEYYVVRDLITIRNKFFSNLVVLENGEGMDPKYPRMRFKLK